MHGLQRGVTQGTGRYDQKIDTFFPPKTSWQFLLFQLVGLLQGSNYPGPSHVTQAVTKIPFAGKTQLVSQSTLLLNGGTVQ